VTSNRRVTITMCHPLLSEVDTMAARESMNRSQFIREAARAYIEQRKRHLRECLERGYQDMADLNRRLANEASVAEHEAHDVVIGTRGWFPGNGAGVGEDL